MLMISGKVESPVNEKGCGIRRDLKPCLDLLLGVDHPSRRGNAKIQPFREMRYIERNRR